MEIAQPTTVTYPDLQGLGKFAAEPLGQGAYGKVLKWTSSATGNEYAVKKFLGSKEGDISADTLREIAILRSLKHPNVIQLLDVGEFAINSLEGPEMVLPLGTGDFGSFVRPDSLYPFGLSLFKDIAYRLCEGLNYLHERGVIHRDFKPANIIVLPGLVPVISDLGSARFGAIPGGKYSNRIQTLWWRSPEVLLGDDTLQDYDSKIDVFSLGVILMELFCRVYPVFGAKTKRDVLLLQISILGHFNELDYPGLTKTKAFSDAGTKVFAASPGRQAGKFEQKVFAYYKGGGSANMPADLKDLLIKMTYPNPQTRISMPTVLADPLWDEVRSRKKIPVPGSCGSNYTPNKAQTPLRFAEDESVVLRRQVLDAGWTMCDRAGFSLPTRMHYRFVYEQFRRRYAELRRNNDRLLDGMEELTTATLFRVIYTCVYIASLLYEVNNIYIEDFLGLLKSTGASNQQTIALFRGIVKVLKFEVAFNTYVEYNYALSGREPLDEKVTTGAEQIAKILYVLEVERELNAEKLARLALEMACRAYGVENPACIRDTPFKETELQYFNGRIVEYVMHLRDPTYSNPGDFRELKKIVALQGFKDLLAKIISPPKMSPRKVAVATAQVPSSVQIKLIDYEVPLLLDITGITLPDRTVVYPAGTTAAIFNRQLQNVTKEGVRRIVASLLCNYTAAVLETIGKAYPNYRQMLPEAVRYFNLQEMGGRYQWTGEVPANIQVKFGSLTSRGEIVVFLYRATEFVGQVSSEVRNKIILRQFPLQEISGFMVRLEVPPQ